MAGRPIKKGVDYFPFFVDFYEDIRMQFLSGRFGLKGTDIFMRLLCRIYKEGYYIKYDNDYALLFAISVGDKKLYGLVNDIVKESVKRGLFDKDIFDQFAVLTSTEIQGNFMRVALERAMIQIIKEYWLIEIPESSEKRKIEVYTLENVNNPPINSISRPINSINRSENTYKKSKVKNSNNKSSSLLSMSNKLKSSNEKDKEEKKDDEDDIAKVLKTYQENISPLPSVVVYKELKNLLNDVEPGVIIKAIEIAALNNARSFNYIKRILEEWICNGLTTKQAVELHLKNKGSKKSSNATQAVDKRQQEFEARLAERRKELGL